MQKEDIERLAVLARIALTSEEAVAFAGSITSILGYVSEIKEITGEGKAEKALGAVNNVMREDTDPHDPALYTDDLLALAPGRDGQYVKVKKILEDI
jgi:aspartyl-tRNA(Asn)/glutamyl-tRNA(Gln) amidotransferase subunit C